MEYVSPLPPNIRPRNLRLGAMLTALIVLVAGIGLTSARGFDWFVIKASLKSKFPGLRWITTQQLADWLPDKQRQQPVLVDVRTRAEWDVSRIPGARHLEPGASFENELSDVPKDAPIVTYCAVGYRSGEMAKRLSAAGFTNVQNLEGSIFQWANERRPLVRGRERATRVHPYNNFWGKLLEPEVRAPLTTDL